MLKSKKVISALLSAALTATMLTAVPASAKSIEEILGADNVAVWVKNPDTDIAGGVWKNHGKKGDLTVRGNQEADNIVYNTKTGKAAAKYRPAHREGDPTFYSVKYDEPYVGDSTVFIVAQLDTYLTGNLGVYSTGDGQTYAQPSSYENMEMTSGKFESFTYDASGKKGSVDRACAPNNNTMPIRYNNGDGTFTDKYMNYSYTISHDEEGSVFARHRYTDNDGVYRDENLKRGSGEDFRKHYGFVLGNAEKYEIRGGAIPYMNIAEAIVVLGTLSDEDIETVRNYLDVKYFGNGFDPFIPVDYSVQKIADQFDPFEHKLPIDVDDPRLALWIDGESFDETAGKWYDKSAENNDMTVYGNQITSRIANDLNGKKVVHFPGVIGNNVTVKLNEAYSGNSVIYFVYKPYKIDSEDAPEGYNMSYKGVYVTEYMPASGQVTGRHGGIDIAHGGNGVALGLESENHPRGDYMTDKAYTGGIKIDGAFAANPGRVVTDDPQGSSYLGYTRGFLDFELETIVGEDKTTMNYDFKDAEGSLPRGNTGTEDIRGLNRGSKVEWDTSGGAADASMHYGYTIGNRQDNNGAGLLMDVAEMIVIQGSLSSAEKNAMSKYLKNKYFIDESQIESPTTLLTKDVTLNYINDEGEPATEGLSAALQLIVKGKITNKYVPAQTDAMVVVAVYSGDRLYAVEMVDVTDITAEGKEFESYAVMLPEDKTGMKVKIFGVSDLDQTLRPVIEAISANIGAY